MCLIFDCQIGSPVSNLSNVSSSFSAGSGVDDFKEDPFKDKDPFAGTAFPSDDPFKGCKLTF